MWAIMGMHGMAFAGIWGVSCKKDFGQARVCCRNMN